MARLRLLALALLCLLAQQLVVAVLPVWLQPSLPLVLALALGLRARSTESLIMAFGLGFVVDTLSGSPAGLHALLSGTACAAARMVDGALFLRAPAPWVLFAALYSVIDTALLAGVLALAIPEAAPGWAAVLVRVPGAAIMNAILAPGVVALVRRADGDSEGEGAAGGLVGSRS